MKTGIVVLGPAGCGKSTLVANLKKWIERSVGLSVGIVNLDPGVRYLPYRPDLDVRDIVRVVDIMDSEKLGPNGAFIRAMDIIATKCGDMVENIMNLEKDYILIDTPGQMELFIFTRAGPTVINRLHEHMKLLGLLLMDASLTTSVSDIVTARLLLVIVQLRLGIPGVLVINKADLLSKESYDLILGGLERLERTVEETDEGLLGQISETLIDLIRATETVCRPIIISAKRSEGLEIVYDIIHEVFCTCGDMT
ncbi:MAG: GTPase [Thermoprotei archaeon]|nr:MAG: GTPase [Thermoprotei archaeon]